MKVNKQNRNDKEISIVYGDNNSININIFNNKILMEIVGSFDNNLKELEKVSGSKIYFRGNSIDQVRQTKFSIFKCRSLRPRGRDSRR